MLKLSHKNLEVYKLSMLLVKEIYAITKLLPKEEQFILTSQLRRAAVSVCSNLAEGASRKSPLEKKRFFEISRGSIVEMDTQFEIAILQSYFKNEQIEKLGIYMESVFRMLSKMIDNLAQN